MPYRAGAQTGKAAHQQPNFFLMLPMPPGNMAVVASGYSAGDGLSGGGLGEGEAQAMQTVKLKRLPFLAITACTIALVFAFYFSPGGPLLTFWQWSLIVNAAVICLLACAAGARFGDFGARPWTGVALMLICLAVVPLAGPFIEQQFVPAEGIDDNSWQEDIPDYVTLTGIVLGLIVLAGAAVPRSRPAP